MDTVLLWQNLVFEIPLLLGIVLALGVAAGGGHDSAGHDIGHDSGLGHSLGGHDAHHDHDHDDDHNQLKHLRPDLAPQVRGARTSLPRGLLVILGIGKVPITVSLMLLMLVFGAAGYCGNKVLTESGMSIEVGVWISLVGAGALSLLIHRLIAGFVARILPTTETYALTADQLVGCCGIVTLSVDENYGQAQVRDLRGDLQQIGCKTTNGALTKGSPILIQSYDSLRRIYTVSADVPSTLSSR